MSMFKQDVLDVLVYLFQNYMSEESEVDADRESVQSELLEAGFPHGEVDKALAWLEELAAQPPVSDDLPGNTGRSIRVFAPQECRKLAAEARGFLLELESAGIVTVTTRELIMDRVMALETHEINLEEMKWVILMVLFNQPGQEDAYAWMEDLVYEGYGIYLH